MFYSFTFIFVNSQTDTIFFFYHAEYKTVTEDFTYLLFCTISSYTMEWESPRRLKKFQLILLVASRITCSATALSEPMTFLMYLYLNSGPLKIDGLPHLRQQPVSLFISLTFPKIRVNTIILCVGKIFWKQYNIVRRLYNWANEIYLSSVLVLYVLEIPTMTPLLKQYQRPIIVHIVKSDTKTIC